MSARTTIWPFVVVVVRRLLRDRTALFFVVVLPAVVMVIIGLTFGGAARLDIGVQGLGASPAAADVADAMEAADGTTVHAYRTLDALRGAVRRHTISAGVVFPDGFDDAVAAGTPEVTLVLLPGSESTVLASDVLTSALGTVLVPADAARFAAQLTGVDVAAAARTATTVGSALPAITVETVDTGRSRRSDLSRFSLVAPQELVLFVFINALASGAALVRMRRTGVLRRVLAGPTGAGTIVTGLLVAWLALSLLQSALILAIGALAFDVDWGAPIGAGALVLAFALVGSGAGLMVGALGGNEDRVSAITPPIGLVLGALGGCMVPLEVFSPSMRGVAHITPHYWAMTAWQRLIFDGDGIGGIAGPLLALLAYAAVFVTIAAIALRRALVR